jgi:signal transduction histidine kinase
MSFLSQHSADREIFMALLNGQFYQSSPEAVPAALQPNSAIVKHWAKLTQPERGKTVIPTDTIYYLAEPVIKGKTHGVFVVLHSNRGDYHEVNEAVFVVILVMITVFAVTSVLAWMVAGQVLAPLRLLTEMARSISESDLTRRIPVQGIDEISELTITFNEMLDRLQVAFATQRNFINDAGHELRTPITIIRGHLELLGDDPQERCETVELVTDELDRMSRFVDDLLLLAKAEQPNF